ncbi:MAG: DNA polymerase III subunit beta [Christensenellaceae bacterium]|jgi:DNA polymerase-3 subunit beta|nr:DNA polymerase III subunit beta [Christensenellaceae bacterium]
MKFSCSPKELSDAAVTVSKAIPAKAVTPILEGIYIRVYESTVSLTATDLDVFIEYRIHAKVILEGEAVVYGKLFSEILGKIADPLVTVEKTSGENLRLSYGENTTSVSCLGDGLFPEMSPPITEGDIEVSQATFKDIVERTAFCAATDDTRPLLRGCLLETKDDKLVCVALDGFRMASARCALISQKKKIKAVVPAKALSEIAKALENKDLPVILKCTSKALCIATQGLSMTIRLYEGEYLDYEAITPTTFTTELIINKKILETCVERALIISKTGNTSPIYLKVEGTLVEVTTETSMGQVKEFLSANISGEPLRIAFNNKFLQESLSKIKEDFVKFSFPSSDRPAVLTTIDDDKFKYLILPMRY